jgi:hypothetical protein
MSLSDNEGTNCTENPRMFFLTHSYADERYVADLITNWDTQSESRSWTIGAPIPRTNDWWIHAERSIGHASVLVFVQTQKSLGSHSCAKEVEVASALGLPIIILEIWPDRGRPVRGDLITSIPLKDASPEAAAEALAGALRKFHR